MKWLQVRLGLLNLDRSYNGYSSLKGMLVKLKGKGIRATLVRGAVNTFVIKILGAGLGFANHVILARVLGVSQYGIFIYVFSWMTILALLSQLGFKTSLVRFIPQYKVQGKWGLIKGLCRRSFQYVTSFSIFIGLALICFSWLWPGCFGEQRLSTFIAAIFGLPFLALMGVEHGILRGLKRAASANLPNFVIRPGLLLGCVVVLRIICKDINIAAVHATAIHSVIMAIAFGIGMVLVATALHTKRYKETEACYTNTKWFRVSLPLLFIDGLYILTQQTSLILLGYLAGDKAAGVFGAITKIATLVTFGLTAVNMIVAPMISELYYKKEMFGLQKLLKFAAWGILVFTVVVASGFCIWGRMVLQLFGSGFIEGYPSLVILLGGQILNALGGPVGFIMLMTGHQKAAALIVGGAVIINVLLGFWLIPLLGLMGGAIALCCATVFWNFGMLFYVWRNLQLNPTILPRLFFNK